MIKIPSAPNRTSAPAADSQIPTHQFFMPGSCAAAEDCLDESSAKGRMA